IISILPRFRIVAVSMKRLQIARAPIVSITIDVIDLNPVIMVEAQLTISTAAVLLFEELGQAWTDTRVPSSSRTPVHPVAIIGTPVPTDFDVPSNRDLTMGQEVDRVRVRGGCGKGETVVHAMPVPLPDPSGSFGGVSSACPAAELFPRELIKPAVDGLAHARAVIVCPSPDFGVELADHLALGHGLRALDDPSQFRQMLLYVGLGGFDQGFEPQAVAVGMFPRVMFAHPVLPDVKP